MSKKTNAEKPKGSAAKTVLKILGVILCVIIVFVTLTSIIGAVGNKRNSKIARSFDTVEYKKQLVPEKDQNGYWTFTTDKKFKILQLSDIHIGAGWMSLKKDKKALNAVAAMVKAEKPDLVIVTGDISYPVPFQAGTINNKTSAKMFADLMENLGVYWTACLGNHDSEIYSLYSRKKIADFYQNSGYKYCLFDKGPSYIDGYGNQIINIKNSKGIITQSLFTLDSHSYTDNDWLGIRWKYDNIHDNQIAWYKESLEKLNYENDLAYKSLGSEKKSDIKSLMFFHIPISEVKEVWDKYAENGYEDTEEIKLIDGFAGGTGKVVYCSMYEEELFETVQELGSTQGLFFGHDHRNSMSFDYKGIRLTYSMSIDYLAIPGINKIGAQRGCTVITVYPNASFKCKSENYYQEKYISMYEKETVEMQEVTYAKHE